MSDAPVITQDWLKAPPLRRVLEVLGAKGETRIAGGAVRNALLGEAVSEVDLATVLTPEAVMAAGRAAGLGVHPTGLDHGTVTLVADGVPFEVTTLRHDVETDGRRAVVAFTDDWAADAARRDFTMNALYCDGQGRIIDHVGGVADALARRLRFVGDPAARIAEDYLRILRFFRFHARYGAGAPDQAALAACAALRGGMAQLSAERVRQELFKLLEAKGAAEALAAMAQTGVLAVILPEASGLATVARMAAQDHAQGWPADAVLRLAALSPAGDLKERLRLSSAEAARIMNLRQAVPPSPQLRASEQRAICHLLGPQLFRDAARLAYAQAGADADAPAWADLISLPERWQVPELPVKGHDLIALGFTPGPALGAALRQLEDWWIAGDFTAGREALLARAAALKEGAP